MNSDKFKLLNKEKELYLYFNTYIYNLFPKNEKVLRDEITREIYLLIKNTALISVNRGNVRNKYIKDVKSNVIMIDFYLSCIYDKQIIVKKRFLKCVNRLSELNKILSAMELNNNE